MDSSGTSRGFAVGRVRLSIGAAVALALLTISVVVGISVMKSAGGQSTVIPLEQASGQPLDDGSQIYVHVLGAVSTPGLYVLDDGARVADALLAAGGALDAADLRSVNLARLLSDGEQLRVAAVGDTPDAASDVATGGDDRIDINTADSITLQQLPRIGPSLAQRIIDWRETNGPFGSVDDLLAVSGIGEKLFGGIRDRVRV